MYIFFQTIIMHIYCIYGFHPAFFTQHFITNFCRHSHLYFYNLLWCTAVLLVERTIWPATQWYIFKRRILLCASWVQFWARIYFWSNIRAPKSPYITFKSNIRASKSPFITFKSNIWAQKWTKIRSNIRTQIMYHWIHIIY